MQDEKMKQQARFLFQFGKRMRDQMLRSHISSVPATGLRISEDLSPAQIHMLLKIREYPDCTISELAALLDVSPPSVSAMVDRLVEKGALIRERSKQDRRVVVVRLSDAAMEHAGRMEKAMLNNFYRIIEKVGPELTEKWCSVIVQVDQALQEGNNANEAS